MYANHAKTKWSMNWSAVTHKGIAAMRIIVISLWPPHAKTEPTYERAHTDAQSTVQCKKLRRVYVQHTV